MRSEGAPQNPRGTLEPEGAPQDPRGTLKPVGKSSRLQDASRYPRIPQRLSQISCQYPNYYNARGLVALKHLPQSRSRATITELLSKTI
ncbi:hypothetical protein TorRG33x02_132290 [Trema orientale]|uniref:Uncharacterized protein n=1 Tax=Trema orientale TaxID=63057 RepID=A0A2P5EZS0_TREOI|nr:hypothetical protein TorRG33x02_132290 [Trema orientale]